MYIISVSCSVHVRLELSASAVPVDSHVEVRRLSQECSTEVLLQPLCDSAGAVDVGGRLRSSSLLTTPSKTRPKAPFFLQEIQNLSVESEHTTGALLVETH